MALKNREAVKTQVLHDRFKDGTCAHHWVEGSHFKGVRESGPCHDNCHPVAMGKIYWGNRRDFLWGLEENFLEENLTFIGPETVMNPSFSEEHLEEVFSFTVLREPRARWISQYHQKVRFNPDLGRTMGLNETAWFKACYKEASTPRECNHLVTLADFLSWMQDGGGYIINGKGHNDNYMARYLLGLKRDFFSGTPRPLGADDLAAAKAVLRDKMNFVLITERMDEAGCLLERLGWSPAAERANVKADDGKDDPAADPEVKALLDELNTVDEELYAYAVELFEEQLAACAGCRCPQMEGAGSGGGHHDDDDYNAEGDIGGAEGPGDVEVSTAGLEGAEDLDYDNEQVSTDPLPDLDYDYEQVSTDPLPDLDVSLEEDVWEETGELELEEVGHARALLEDPGHARALLELMEYEQELVEFYSRD